MTGAYNHKRNDANYDICIVGNGSLGLSLGVTLAREGLKVVVIGQAARTTAASTAAGAMNGCFGEVTTSLLASEHGLTKLEMDVEATQLWNDWATLLCEDAGIKPSDLRSETGTMIMLNTIGSHDIDTENFKAIEQSLITHETPYEMLEGEEISWISPEETSRPLKALYIPGEHSVNTPVLFQCLQNSFVKAGGTLVEGTVKQLEMLSEYTVCGAVLVDGTKISAATTVVAAGVQSHDLLATASSEIASQIPPMVSGYGVSVLLKTEDGQVPPYVIRTPNRAFACGLHIVPRTDGTAYLGATNIISNSPQIHAAISDLNFLTECGYRQLHTALSESRISEIQVGNRPIPLDGFPLVGPAGLEGVWLMTGTYRDGLHQSPLLADELTNRIMGGEGRPQLAHFNPVRKPLMPMKREQIIKDTVTHMMATGYESDWKVPVEWLPRMERHLIRFYTTVAESLSNQFTPPPEIIAAMNDGIREKLAAYYASYENQSKGKTQFESPVFLKV